MSTLPQPPYFLVCRDSPAIDLKYQLETQLEVNQLALVERIDECWQAYDAAGRVWAYAFQRPAEGLSLLQRILARTVYNPRRRVDLHWRLVRHYELRELRDRYVDAIGRDDDILTQFVDGNELVRRLQACTTFGEIVATFEWAQSDPPEADADDRY